MPSFLLLLAPKAGPGEGDRFDPGGLQSRTGRFVEWVAKGARAGVIRAGARLGEREVRLSRGDGVTTVAETARAVAGYFVIEAEDLPAALAIAAGCPAADPGTISVHPIDPEATLRPEHQSV